MFPSCPGKKRKRENSDLLVPATKDDQKQSQWQPEGQRMTSYPNQNMSSRVWGTSAPSHNFHPPQLQPQITFVTQNVIQPLLLEPFMRPLLPPGHKLSYPFHHRQLHTVVPAVPNLHVNPPANLQVNPAAPDQLPAFVSTNPSLPDLSPHPSFWEDKELPKPTLHILPPANWSLLGVSASGGLGCKRKMILRLRKFAAKKQVRTSRPILSPTNFQPLGDGCAESALLVQGPVEQIV
ncbi:hypothetical protein BT69DRAFT_812892 [Atractiella rhizophila]|nr:hypothetical protein BT69DRAFT_812892 [Atractiella rhizophila]